MNISKREVGEGLKRELNKGFNIERIANWAYDLSIKFHYDFELDDILDQISLMDAGPEFEYSEEELVLLSKMLINEEKNPIEKINEHASNRNLGSQMLEELKKGNNIGKWALNIYQNYLEKLNPLQKEILEKLSNPSNFQNQYSEKELITLANFLIKNEKEDIRVFLNIDNL